MNNNIIHVDLFQYQDLNSHLDTLSPELMSGNLDQYSATKTNTQDSWTTTLNSAYNKKKMWRFSFFIANVLLKGTLL